MSSCSTQLMKQTPNYLCNAMNHAYNKTVLISHTLAKNNFKNNNRHGDYNLICKRTRLGKLKTYPLDAAAETKIGSTGLHFMSKTLQQNMEGK